MANKNSPDPTLVSAVDPRTELQSDLDATIMKLEARNRALAAQRKQLDLEIQANDDAITVAKAGIAQLDEALAASRATALMEQQ